VRDRSIAMMADIEWRYQGPGISWAQSSTSASTVGCIDHARKNAKIIAGQRYTTASYFIEPARAG
jgi:hypothetical protein